MPHKHRGPPTCGFPHPPVPISAAWSSRIPGAGPSGSGNSSIGPPWSTWCATTDARPAGHSSGASPNTTATWCRAAGAILGIGPAAPCQTELLQRRGIPFPLLLDPERRVARAIGLGRLSLLPFLADPRGWHRWLASWFRGEWQGAVTA